MIEVRRGTQKLYKGKYFIVFYDKADETLKYMFDNVRDILKFMERPINRQNVIEINTRISRALMSDTHFIRFLTGEVLRVYIIDTD